jgi:PIN domain nuclease of toxin-antitoxin system
MGGPAAILLDTHTLIWPAEGDPQLGDRARHLADEALAHDDVVVSAITFWEIAMLHQRGRIRLVQPIEAWRVRLIGQGVRELPPTGEVGIAAATLLDFHPAPADRFITATALLYGATLVTADDRILTWSGTLQRHDARQ